MIVDLDHNIVLDPCADIWRCSFPELLDEILLALLLIVDGSLLEVVDDPLVIVGGHLNVELLKLLNLLLGNLVELGLK